MSQHSLRHIANLWTLMEHPSKEREWSLEEKLQAIKDAGFDGVCWAGSSELQEGCHRHGLVFVGGMSSGKAEDFPQLLGDLRKFGAHHVNVQLADDDTPASESLRLALAIMEVGHGLGLQPAIELHRDTCTETPEKLYALADGYQAATGKLLPISWDFSHAAVVKHLAPENYVRRLLLRPDLIQLAQQFHFRPFNGHHAQVPVTDARGEFTPEMKDWLPFAEAVLRCWLEGNRHTAREILVCPEMGPLAGGYGLSTFPNSWADAKVLRLEIERLWQKVLGS